MLENHRTIMPKSKIPSDPEKSRNVAEIVGHLMSHMEKIHWATEIRCAQKLYAQYPYPEFWRQISWPGKFRPDSLRALLGEWGREFLQCKFNLYNLKSADEDSIVLVGKVDPETKICDKKPRTVMEFLK